MLFTAPLFKILNGENRRAGLKIRGYVDDGLLTSVAASENEAASKASRSICYGKKVKKWVYENGLSFDLGKFEAIHFSRKRNLPNPSIHLRIGEETELVVTPVPKSSALRWLGVYFDSRLSFVNHAEKMAAKGRLAATGLRMLTKTTWGVEAEVMRRAVNSCILPILAYAAPAWWPGKTRINKAGHTIQNGVERHCKKLSLAQNIALRAILPVWRTTPVAVLQLEAGIPPIHHTLNHLCLLASLRLHRLEPKHPLRLRTKDEIHGRSPTRLERLAKLCEPKIEYSNPLAALEPWEANILGSQSYLDASGGTGNKKVAAENVKKWIKKAGPLDMLLYTDGSQEYDKAGNPSGTGAGWVIEWVGSWFSKGGTALGTTQEVYDAEAFAMTRGLEIALESPMARHAPAICICLDNLSVAKNAGKIPNGSSQATFIKFRELAKLWLAKKGKMLTVQWILENKGIKGNELADLEAQRYASKAVNPRSCIAQSLSNAKQ